MPKSRLTSNQQPDMFPNMETKKRADSFDEKADHLVAQEIKRLKRDYNWSNDGEAFAHLFVQYMLDLAVCRRGITD